MVIRQSHKTRLLAAFVALFICLNAGGALCVAYCRGVEMSTVADHHAAGQTGASHCDKAKTGSTVDSVSVASGGDCCPMTLSFIGVPIESAWLRFEAPVAVVAPRMSEPRLAVTRSHFVAPSQTYCGPPPKDRRVERIKHRLLLI